MLSAWTTFGRVLVYSVRALTFMTDAMFEPHWQTNTPILGPSVLEAGFFVVFLIFLAPATFFRAGIAVGFPVDFLGMRFYLHVHSSFHRVSCFLGTFRFEFFGHVCR